MTASSSDDDFEALFAPEATELPVERGGAALKVLLVDDEQDVHAALRLTLQELRFEGVALELLDAYSAAQAKATLSSHPDVALILLDVVMETEDAGLALVEHVRHAVHNRMVRIILLTGQPGQSPERKVVTAYEIDDYRLKTELSSDRIYTFVFAALRTYRALQDLESKRSIETLAQQLQSANTLLQHEVAERKQSQTVAQMRMQELMRLNKKLEEAHMQLLQSEKMASIGLLAAGVAHEINNPIGFVNSNLGTLDRYVRDLLRIIDAYIETQSELGAAAAASFGPVEQLKQELELDYLRTDLLSLLSESHEGLDRVKRIVLSMLDFSRVNQQDHWVEEDLLKGLETTLSVVWNALKYKCEVRREYAQIPKVQCIISELNQVFMNLLVNGAHAIEQQGTITIRTGYEAQRVWVEIEDNGSGISPEHLPHIFDPFFSTKPVGQGTGLGLAVSFNIVERHHGHIEVHSTPGSGTRFRVWLPVKQP